MAPFRTRVARELLAPPKLGPGARARHLAVRGWPVVVWLLAIGLTLSLYDSQLPSAETYAVPTSWEAEIAPSIPGRVEELMVDVGAEVRAGDVLATLDASDLDERIRLIRAEMSRRMSDDAPIGIEIRDTGQGSSVVLRDDTERRDKRFETDTQLRAFKTELSMIGPRIARTRTLMESHLATQFQLDALLLRQAELERKIPELETGFRYGEFSARSEALAIAQLELERKKYRLVARESGKVVAVLRHPGDWVAAGASVAQVVVQKPGAVTAFVSDRLASSVKPGMRAALVPHMRPGPALVGKVVAVSPRIEEVPLRLRHIPSVVEWGRSVQIEVKPSPETIAGETFRVRISQ